MIKYLVSEESHGNWAGRVDTAVIIDLTVSDEKVAEWEKTFGTPDFHGWQDNPRIVQTFMIDPCDESMGYDQEEYERWLDEHEGEYVFDDGSDDDDENDEAYA